MKLTEIERLELRAALRARHELLLQLKRVTFKALSRQFRVSLRTLYAEDERIHGNRMRDLPTSLRCNALR